MKINTAFNMSPLFFSPNVWDVIVSHKGLTERPRRSPENIYNGHHHMMRLDFTLFG